MNIDPARTIIIIVKSPVLKKILFSVYSISRFFRFSSIWRRFDLLVDLYPLIHTLIKAHLAVQLIWRRHSIAKGANKNTSPNVIRLQ